MRTRTIYSIQFEIPNGTTRSALLQDIPRIGESVIFVLDDNHTIFEVSDVIWVVPGLDGGDAKVTVQLVVPHTEV